MSESTALRSAITPWLLGSTLVAVVVLVIVLAAGGGAPRASPGGLPDAGPLTGWGLPVVRLLVDLTGFVTVGLTLVGSRVIHAEQAAPDDALPAAGRTAAVWAVLAVLQALLHVSELRAVPLLTTDLEALGGLVTALGRSPEAQAMLVQAALATSVVWFAGLGRSTSGATVALAIAVAAFLPQTLTGHAAAGDDQVVASASLVVHVSAAALWVGGLAALAWLTLRGRAALATAVPRYSALALGCVIAVAASGVLNAVIRVGSVDALFGTAYGVIVLAKVTALVVLTGFGALHRRHTVERLRSRGRHGDLSAVPAFVALASVELTVMAATVALAVGLSRTPPPQTADAQAPAGTSTVATAPSASGFAR